VRGDSLRDFYAKSLALLGLAALAGVGALVDYWPTDIRTPLVARAQLPQPDPASIPALPSADVVARLTSGAFSRRVTSTPALTPAIAEAASVQSEPVEPIVWIAPPPPSLALDLAPATTGSFGEELSLALPPTPLPIENEPPTLSMGAALVPLAAPSLSANNDDSSVAMLRGALRKTGRSIVKGGAKTGASIMDAMRAVGGAFKKVPWF